jgi:hypothetical protein
MKEETTAVWAERIEEWKRSGKSAPEFAADKPYASSTMIWAASRLRRAGSKGQKRRVAAKRAPAGRGTVAGEIAMAKVVRRSGRRSTAADLVVEVAGARISVRHGFDTTLLRDVVQALREGR